MGGLEGGVDVWGAAYAAENGRKDGRGGELERSMFPCEAKSPPEFVFFFLVTGILGRQTGIITSGCQHDTASCRGMPAGTSGLRVYVYFLHIPLLSLVCMYACLSVCVLFCEPSL